MASGNQRLPLGLGNKSRAASSLPQGCKSTMSEKAADQDASVSMVSTSEISAVDRLTSEWMTGVMRLPRGISRLTSIHLLLNACINVHANIGLSLAVDIPIDGRPGIAASPSPKIQAGSEGILAEFVALVGQDDLYIILPAILADNKDGTLTSIKTMGTNEMGDEGESETEGNSASVSTFQAFQFRLCRGIVSTA